MVANTMFFAVEKLDDKYGLEEGSSLRWLLSRMGLRYCLINQYCLALADLPRFKHDLDNKDPLLKLLKSVSVSSSSGNVKSRIDGVLYYPPTNLTLCNFQQICQKFLLREVVTLVWPYLYDRCFGIECNWNSNLFPPLQVHLSNSDHPQAAFITLQRWKKKEQNSTKCPPGCLWTVLDPETEMVMVQNAATRQVFELDLTAYLKSVRDNYKKK